MNSKSKIRWLVVSVAVFVTLNLVQLAGIQLGWFTRSKPPASTALQPSVEDIITREVGMDQQQSTKFRELFRKMRQIKSDFIQTNMNLRMEIATETFTGKPDTAKLNSMCQQIGKLEEGFATSFSTLFLEVKAFCRPDQIKKLETIMRRMSIPEGEQMPQSSTRPKQ